MDEREKLMLEKIRPERHLSAMLTLANIKFIKEECSKNRNCVNCRFHIKSSECLTECILNMGSLPEDYNEYDITERIYK